MSIQFVETKQSGRPGFTHRSIIWGGSRLSLGKGNFVQSGIHTIKSLHEFKSADPGHGVVVFDLCVLFCEDILFSLQLGKSGLKLILYIFSHSLRFTVLPYFLHSLFKINIVDINWTKNPKPSKARIYVKLY